MATDNYPLGAANDPLAPYNEETEIREFLVSVVVSKSIEVEVAINKNNDDLIYDLKDSEYKKCKKILGDDWDIDNLEIIKE